MVHIVRFRARPIAIALLSTALVVHVAPPAMARGLTGSLRADFLRIYGDGCMKFSLADPDIAKLPRATRTRFCRCSAQYLADRITPAQIDQSDSPQIKAVEREAARVCTRL